MSKIYLNSRVFLQNVYRAASCMAAFFVFSALASAATYTVDTTSDSSALSACTAAAGDCSLRGAVNKTHGTVAADTITFAIPAADPNCPGGVCTITLVSGQLPSYDVADVGALIITNPTGAANLRISGNNVSRIFSVEGAANLTVNGVSVVNGRWSDFGGGGGGGILVFGTDFGVLVNATLTLTNSIVSGNASPNTGGGGISNYGNLTITNSTVSGNTANYGGGINNQSGTVSLTNSTVSGNTAVGTGSAGGGISNSGTLAITNSTVSGNASTRLGVANGKGGGIVSDGSATLTNSTVSGNRSFEGGGIYVNSGTLALTSVTVAANTANTGGGIYNSFGFATADLNNTISATNVATLGAGAPDFNGEISPTSTFNLIGNGRLMTGISNGSGGNQVGASLAPIDAKLDPTLALNGGTTLNHALLTNSPAVDKGNAAGTDQRGFTRPSDVPSIPNAAGGNGADIGAFEVQFAPTAANASLTGRVRTSDGRGLRNAVVVLTDIDGGSTRYARTSSFGYFRFDGIAAGSTVVVSISSKQYTFESQALTLTEDTDISFYSEGTSSRKDDIESGRITNSSPVQKN